MKGYFFMYKIQTDLSFLSFPPLPGQIYAAENLNPALWYSIKEIKSLGAKWLCGIICKPHKNTKKTDNQENVVFTFKSMYYCFRSNNISAIIEYKRQNET